MICDLAYQTNYLSFDLKPTDWLLYYYFNESNFEGWCYDCDYFSLKNERLPSSNDASYLIKLAGFVSFV
jgi:hypothetical protein